MAAAAKKFANLHLAVWNQSLPTLKKHLNFAKVELAPPGPAQITEFVGGIGKGINTITTGKFLNWSVKDATVNGLIGLEIGLKFKKYKSTLRLKISYFLKIFLLSSCGLS